MRALTVRQPWAWAIIHGGKDVENRSRSLGPYRGLVAIHAGLTDDSDTDPSVFDLFARLVPAWDAPPTNGDPWQHRPDGVRGAIIGVVDLLDVHLGSERTYRGAGVTMLCSTWARINPDGTDAWHLVLADPRPLAHPIPWRGALGLWPVPADLEAQIRAGATP